MFPSGEWEGFYTYSGQEWHRDKMSLHLYFQEGVVKGVGSDPVGEFTYNGTYSTLNMSCQMTKHYITHRVLYEGHVDENGIWGTWTISKYATGGFHIWPKAASGEKKVEETLVETDVSYTGISKGIKNK